MISKFIKLCAAGLLAVFSFQGYAQTNNDTYGLQGKTFIIQAANEAGKSADGLWDIPGHPGKTDGNLKGTAWKQMEIYQREKGDPEDRVFRFTPSREGNGKYFIWIGRNSSWGVNALDDGSGRIEARSRADVFELIYIGDGKWKIQYKPGTFISREQQSTKNGTKLSLKGDSALAEWVFFDIATGKSFAPKTVATQIKTSYKGTLKETLSYKKPSGQYFEYADGVIFNSENTDKILQSYLNDMSTMDQWNAILEILNAACRNKDTDARRSIYKAMAECDVKKGRGFAENLLKSQIVKRIKETSNSEKDVEVKEFLNTLSRKF